MPRPKHIIQWSHRTRAWYFASLEGVLQEDQELTGEPEVLIRHYEGASGSSYVYVDEHFEVKQPTYDTQELDGEPHRGVRFWLALAEGSTKEDLPPGHYYQVEVLAQVGDSTPLSLAKGGSRDLPRLIIR